MRSYMSSFGILIGLAVSVQQPEYLCVGREDGGDVGNPAFVLADSGVSHLEAFLPGMKGNGDPHPLVVFVDDLPPQQGRQEGCYALLAVIRMRLPVDAVPSFSRTSGLRRAMRYPTGYP